MAAQAERVLNAPDTLTFEWLILCYVNVTSVSKRAWPCGGDAIGSPTPQTPPLIAGRSLMGSSESPDCVVILE